MSGVISHEVESPGGPGPQVEAAARRSGAPRGPLVFMGSYEHSVDDKNRLVLPATFRGPAGRRRLPRAARRLPRAVARRGLRGRVPRLGGRHRARPRLRGGVRRLLAATFQVQPDAQGRIVVPRSLRAFADLAGPVMVVGARQRIARVGARSLGPAHGLHPRGARRGPSPGGAGPETVRQLPPGSARVVDYPRGAAPLARRSPAGAVEGPFSARFPSSPSRGDIPASAAEWGSRERAP